MLNKINYWKDSFCDHAIFEKDLFCGGQNNKNKLFKLQNAIFGELT